MNKIAIKTLDELGDREPAYALVGDVDLCVVRYDDNVSVFYGRCLHRGALMADGHVDGENLICGVHYWDYRLDTGVSEYNNEEVLAQVHLVDRGWPGSGRCGRDRRLGAGPPAAPSIGMNISASTPIPTPPPKSLMWGSSRTMPGTGSARPAITASSWPWACRARTCRAGTTFSSSRRNFTACPTSTMSRSAPRW